MVKIVNAILLSVAIHGFIAVALIAYLEYAPQPDVLATLDLSSVELSFAETVDEAAAVAPSPASVGRAVPSPPQEERPPEAKLEKSIRREPGEIKFPEPKEDARLKTEDVKAKDERRETEDKKAVNTPPVAPRQARLDAPPKPKQSIKPKYPKGAQQRGEQGDVTLEIRVTAEGTVDNVKVAVSSGFSELDEAAIKAVRSAKFSPARSGREAVASVARLKLSFKLK